MSDPGQYPSSVRSDDARITPFTFQQHAWRKRYQSADHLSRLDDVFAVRLTGRLKADLLSRSFEELIGRHELLRARIVLEDHFSRQIVDELGDYELSVIRVDDVPENGTEMVRSIFEELAHRRCKLVVGPLFDAKLLKCSEQDHVLVWGINHFISDGYSLNVMFRELWLLYREHLGGRPSPLRKLPAQFSDYHGWQRDMYRVWQLKHQSYWEHHLAGAAGVRWPTDRCGLGVRREGLTQVPMSFSDVLSNGLRTLTQRAQTLLPLGVMAVYVAVIRHWCDQEDFVLANLLNGRDRPEHRYIVGFLAHLTYFRMQLTGEETFIDLLDNVTQEYCRTLFRKDFGGLVTEVPDLSGTYFQWLSWGTEGVCGIPTPEEAKKIDIIAELLPFEQTVCVPDNFRFSVTLWNTGEGIRGTALCSAELFTEDTLKRFERDMRTAAVRFVENPSARVSTILP